MSVTGGNTPGIGAPLLIVIVLAMLVLPIPAIGLDLLFTFNIALALIVLLVTIYTPKPLAFSSFPAVLLIATMLRLALNIASTRVVLQHGHTGTASAGSVIESFGNFVIGGNYAVGLVVFAILVIINFVVVTKGAGRVSEVTARFTLDAMPGKQMAIDADLNAGAIDQADAKRRRAEIVQESDFYGSMDGASKFVRGDAIAGLLILLINIFGGLAIGVGQYDLGFGQAVHNYSLLTIGDGLAAQVPSLLLSMATALIVTRASGEEDMGSQVLKQITLDKRAIVTSATIIGGLGLIPGMPNFMFLTLAAVLGFLAWYSDTTGKAASDESSSDDSARSKTDKELTWEDVSSGDILNLEVGYQLISLVDEQRGGKLLDRIRGVRRKLTEDLGFLIHPVHIRDNLELEPGQYKISVQGVLEGDAVIYPDREMAINPGGVSGSLPGTRGKDPAFGMDAIWIEPAMRDRAQSLGYTVVDASTVVATHLNKILQDSASDLLGHDEAQQWLDKVEAVAPKLISDLVPKTLSLAKLVKVLQNLLSDGIPIRDMRIIAEALAEKGGDIEDTEALTAHVRVALRRLITQQIAGNSDSINVITVDAQLEQIWLQSLSAGENGGDTAGLGMEPGLAERFYQSLAQSAESQTASGNPAVLLVNPKVRPWLARLIKYNIPTLKVISYAEVADNRKIKVIANIGNTQLAGAEATEAA
ncbi:flagellar biosynthesis protein FlhA [Chromatiales bacterium (ex Bugula neritina AB1)]|nr:flagellar biosynthesis protein FlhA [Chromatiales bacterium (ex Bugula neritina AB1)]